MSDIPVKRVTTEVDPTFFIPDGVDEIIYTEEDNIGEVFNEDFSLDGEGETVTEDSGRLPAPDTFKIISQDTHKIKGGQKVVDIVAQVETIRGAVKYEIRVTKI